MSKSSLHVSSRVVSLCFALALLLASFALIAAPVDINTADADTLASELQGIGATKAAAIVAYRQSNGPFRRLEDLLKVKGIGEKTLEQNRTILLIGEQE